MTVSTTSNKVSFSANGSTTVFAYNFKIFADADLTVIIRAADGTETTKTLTTHYTVSGAGSASGGNVTFTSGNTPANGETVVIARQLTKTQGTDYVANDPFPAESHEDALDRLTFITQELQEEVDRSIKASVTNTLTGAEFTISATDRANKVFSFDASGNLAVTQELGTFRGNWAASTAYAVRDLVKDTSTNNIFIVNTAHTSSGAQPLTSNANSAKYDLIVDAATATSAQTAAASSASSASTSASTATTKAAEAATSATNAATSATTATTKASEASTSASNASTSESNAASSASSASTSASTATTKASEASTSASNAASSASTATTKASEAATSATNAASSATTASTQASNASTSASTATTKASEAATSATNAATSATAAASSATAAAASQTSAAASAASAASAFDNFDDTYLGSFSSNPSTDNDGDALVAGALYFNSTANEMRVYDGANWIAATSAGNVSLILYEYTATSNQTTFSGSDDNSATLSYTVDNLQVVMNGVILDPSDYTATSGTSVVLAAGAAANDLINIYAFKSFTTADMVSKTNGGTFAGAVGFTSGFTASDGCTITTADNTTQLTLTSTDADAAVGPVMDFNRNSASAADNDLLGRLNFIGKNDAGEDVEYGFIRYKIADASDGSEDGDIAIKRMVAGTSSNMLNFKETETIFNEDSKDIDFRVESNGNANMLFVDGGNDAVILGANSTTASGSPALESHGSVSIIKNHTDTSSSGNISFGAGNQALTLSNAQAGANDLTSKLGFTVSTTGANTDGLIEYASTAAGSGEFRFYTEASNTIANRMTIDSNGHILIGQSATDSPGDGNTTAGATIHSTGRIFASASGAASGSFNRNTNDGSIINFRHDGTICGEIGQDADAMYIGFHDCGLIFQGFFDNAIIPYSAEITNIRDDVIDLGYGSARFDDIFATNTSITTSDQTEKQQIAALTSAEMTAAKAISALFKTYKWNKSVTNNGDAARIHTGVIAQEVQAAMSDAGLDASKYAFWCSNTWWEADETYTNDAGEEKTRTRQYHVEDEAPEGATKRTRLGIRYPELLAFIGAATEQRLADIETRLTALEAGE